MQENIKPIINYLFDNFRPRIEALSSRPFLRSFIHGLTARWEQNNEPPPAPPPADAESSKAWSNRAAEAEEEDYFNASDEEEIGPKPPAKRKRMITIGGGPPKKRGGGMLGLDYDDGDSEGSGGSQSPRLLAVIGKEESGSGPVITSPEELEGDLGDVAMRMRAKRLREEQEEEGFAGMLVAKKPVWTNPRKEKEKEKEKEEKENVGGGGKREGTPIKEKKLKLSFTGFGKRLGGGGAAK